MSNATPNVDIINRMIQAKSAHDVMSILDGECVVEIMYDAVEYIMNGEYKDNKDKACLMEFCIRHGGLTMTNARRFSPVFKQGTNRCSVCRNIGHDKNHCPGVNQIGLF